MKAYVTSIGEPTTDLCVWSLERNGFEVILLKEPKTTLAQKLKEIYDQADDDFVRVDADVIPNNNLTPQLVSSAVSGRQWWVQFLTFDWYKQDTTHGGVQFIKKEAIPALRQRIYEAMNEDRPESYMYRIPEFHNPRRCDWNPCIMGMTNYKQDMKRVMQVKANRGQSHNYDFELAQRIEEL